MDDDDFNPDPGHLWKFVLASSVAALLGLIAIGATDARSHEAPTGWRYDGFCCNGNNHTGDCQQIPAERVRITKDGYLIDIRPGDHRLATVHHLFTVKHGDQRRSQDGDYHLCLYPDENTLRCFYAPDMGF